MATGRRPESRKLKRMTVRFYEDDLDALRDAYPNAGYNKVIRALVSKFVRVLQAKATEKLEVENEDDLIKGLDELIEKTGGPLHG